MTMVSSMPCSSAAFAELSREFLNSGTSVRFRARGASMSPLVRDGDTVLVRPLAEGALRVGDVVILCDTPDHLVVHRVVRRHSGPGGVTFTIQGDQGVRPDGTFEATQVWGRVVAVEREGMHVDLDRPVMRLLGRLAVLRSRWNVGRGRPSRLARSMLKRLPVFSKYLA